MLKKFGSEVVDDQKSRQLAEKLAEASQKVNDDSGFAARIEDDPDSALAEIGFPAGYVRSFRLLENVSTASGCSCSCFPLSCGTGVGCFGGPQGPPGSTSSGCP